MHYTVNVGLQLPDIPCITQSTLFYRYLRFLALHIQHCFTVIRYPYKYTVNVDVPNTRYSMHYTVNVVLPLPDIPWLHSQRCFTITRYSLQYTGDVAIPLPDISCITQSTLIYSYPILLTLHSQRWCTVTRVARGHCIATSSWHIRLSKIDIIQPCRTHPTTNSSHQRLHVKRGLHKNVFSCLQTHWLLQHCHFLEVQDISCETNIYGSPESESSWKMASKVWQ